MIRLISSISVSLLAVCLILGCNNPTGGGGGGGSKVYGPSTTEGTVFFLHHSTGNGFIVDGDIRASFEAYNLTSSITYEFWDHGYNSDGLRDEDGNSTGTNYAVPGDNTNPDGLYDLWTSKASNWTHTRNEILNHYHEIAFKSCFPASDIPDATTLQQYKDWYIAIIASCETNYPTHTFVIMSTPPLHPLDTNGGNITDNGTIEAANTRDFANWLTTECTGHANIVYFNLFNYLADPATNMLSAEYQGSTTESDSHPNTVANQMIGRVFAKFLLDNY